MSEEIKGNTRKNSEKKIVTLLKKALQTPFTQKIRAKFWKTQKPKRQAKIEENKK